MPVALPLGYRPNILLIMNDDGMQSMYDYMPLWKANWDSQFVDYTTNSSGNAELCAPARACTLTGQYIEHHLVTGNDDGASLNLQNTILVALERAGYHVGGIGKWLNGWGESNGWGTAMRIPGLSYQRLMYGKLSVFDYEICDESAAITVYGEDPEDYAQDVEGVHALEFLATRPAHKPWALYWAPRVPHGGNEGLIPAPRHEGMSINLVNIPTFGLDPVAAGWAPFFVESATDPWDAAAIQALTQRRKNNARGMLSQDEAIHAMLTQMQATGQLDNTVVIICTDNGHADGEGRQEDKGTPQRASAQIMLKVRYPGQAGGTRLHAVSNVDIAPTICELTGARLAVAPDGMSFVRTLTDASATHRKAALLSMPVKPPTHMALWAADGRVYYEGTGDLAGQAGSWSDYWHTQDTGVQPDLKADMAVIRERGIYEAPTAPQPPSGPPELLTSPGITGTAQQGETLTISTPANWTGDIASVGTRWQRNTGTGWTVITGSIGTTYALTGSDVGASVRAQQQAVGPTGLKSPWHESNASGTISAALPVLDGAVFDVATCLVGQSAVLRLDVSGLPSLVVDFALTINLSPEASLAGPSGNYATTVTTTSQGTALVEVSYTAASADTAASVAATLNGSSASATVAVSAALYDRTEPMDGAATTQVITLSGVAVDPPSETTHSTQLRLDGSGNATWTATGDAPAPGAALIYWDTGSQSNRMDITFSAIPSGASSYYVISGSDKANGISAEVASGGGSAKLHALIAGVRTQIVSFTQLGLVPGDTLSFEVLMSSSGVTLAAYKNGTKLPGTIAAPGAVVYGSKCGISTQGRRGGYAQIRVRELSGDAVVPVLETSPVLSGEYRDGQTISATAGVWQNAVSVDRRWRVGGVLQSETGLSLPLEIGDVGLVPVYSERATGSDGVPTAWADVSGGVVAAAAPVFAGLSFAESSAVVGGALTATLTFNSMTHSGTTPISVTMTPEAGSLTGPSGVQTLDVTSNASGNGSVTLAYTAAAADASAVLQATYEGVTLSTSVPISAPGSPPVITINGPAVVDEGQTCLLTATGTGLTGATWAWTQTDGPTITGATGAATPSLSFVMPLVSADATVTWQCVVTTGLGTDTKTHSVLVQDTAPPAVLVPMALGANLATGNEYSVVGRDYFANALWQGKSFQRVTNTQIECNLDANGWPLEDWIAPVMNLGPWAGGVPLDGGLFGRWTLVYEGPQQATFSKGTSSMVFTLVSHTFTPGAGEAPGDGVGVVTYDITSTSKANYPKLTNTAGGSRNMKLWRPGVATDGSAHIIASGADLLGPFSAGRTMDATGANAMIRTTFAEEPTSQNRHTYVSEDPLPWTGRRDAGLPMDLLMDLMNAHGKDVWVHFPILLPPSEMTPLANRVADLMVARPNIPKLTGEFNNEIWNPNIGPGYQALHKMTFERIGYVQAMGAAYVSVYRGAHIKRIEGFGTTIEVELTKAPPTPMVAGVSRIRCIGLRQAAGRAENASTLVTSVVNSTTFRYQVPAGGTVTGRCSFDKSGCLTGFAPGSVKQVVGNGTTATIELFEAHSLGAPGSQVTLSVSDITIPTAGNSANWAGALLTPHASNPAIVTYPCAAIGTVPNPGDVVVEGFAKGDVASIVCDGLTATMTFAINHGIAAPVHRQVDGASQPSFNKASAVLTVVDATHLSYASTAWGVGYPVSIGWMALNGGDELFATSETNVFDIAMGLAMLQTYDMGVRLKTAFVNRGISSRLHGMVFAWQAGTTTRMEKALLLVEALRGPVANGIYALSNSNYINLRGEQIYGGDFEDVTDTADTPEEILDAMQTCVDFLPVKNSFRTTIALAYSHGLKYVVYEIGHDTQFSAFQDAASLARKDARIVDIGLKALQQWGAMGASEAHWYTTSITRVQYKGPGTFGLGENRTEVLASTPREQQSVTFQSLTAYGQPWAPVLASPRHVLSIGTRLTIDGRTYLNNDLWARGLGVDDPLPPIPAISSPSGQLFLLGKRIGYDVWANAPMRANVELTLQLTTQAASTISVRVGNSAGQGRTSQVTGIAVPAMASGTHTVTFQVTLTPGANFLYIGDDAANSQVGRMRVASLALDGVALA